MRKITFDMLNEASKLLPKGYAFKIFDAWRPVAVQKYLFNRYAEKLMFEKGIDFSFKANAEFNNKGVKSNKITLFFRMPQIKAHTSFLASISQPVYSPTIRFNYPAEKYDVKMYPFFNNSVEASVEQAELGVGNCYININEKWVHPMSGVVFMINGK